MFNKAYSESLHIVVEDVQKLEYPKGNNIYPAGELEGRAMEYAALHTHKHPESKETLELALESGYEQEVIFEAIKRGIEDDGIEQFLKWYEEHEEEIIRATYRAILISAEFGRVIQEATDSSRPSVFARIGAWFTSNRVRGKAYLNI